MNDQEFRQLLNQAQAIGLTTLWALAWFKRFWKCNNNRDLLNAVNAVYCRSESVAA